MAKLLTDDLTYVSFPITKFEEDADGNLIVSGRVTDGSVDSDKQVVDPQFSGKALTDWMSSGPNVRVMHSPSLYPAGRGLQVDLGDDAHELKSLVVEDTAKKLVRNKVLRAYSVGITNPVIKRDPTGKAPGGIIVGGELAEVSLVDRPANKNCQLVLAKSADLDIPWTYGDLAALLAEAETTTITKSGKPNSPQDPTDGDADDGEGDDLDDDEQDPEEANKAAYRDAILTWRANEPKRGDAPLTGTEYLAKAAAWQNWDAHGQDWGLDGTDAGYTRWLAKRDMDPDVGGGVDRDKIPDEDHVDPEGRRFPIVTPGDVSDAVSSYGQAKPLIPMKRFRRRLFAIARRKGPDFEAELPQSWKKPRAADEMAEADVTKGGKDCPRCGRSYDADAKTRRCEGCGKKLPRADMEKGAGVDTDDLAEKNQRLLPPDVKPAGEHSEPDGDAVEALEHDAGMHTDPDPTHDQVPASIKGKPKGKKPAFPGAAAPFESDGEPDGDEDDDTVAKSPTRYQVKRMHDALCAAYHWDTVTAEYPALKGVGDAVVPNWFTQQVQAAATKGDMAHVVALAGTAQHADALAKGLFDPAALADGRALVHKSFSDMYPTEHLTPGAPPQPGQFQRPYISAGHSPLNAAMNHAGPNIPPATHTINPDMFDRPLITEGHEAESPSNKSDNVDTGGTVRTGASRTYYRNASKEAARQAMQAMHDHIAGTFPDMCPMAASKAVLPTDMGDTNRPHPVRPMDLPKAPAEKTTQPALLKAEAGLTKKQARKLIDQALAKQARALTTKYEQTIAALQQEIDELGAQPDPAQAPLRGVVAKAAAMTDGPHVVEKVNLVDKARQEAAAQQAEYVEYLADLTKSANPAVREQAATELAKFAGNGALTKAA